MKKAPQKITCFIPREKMSKKARRQLDLAARKNWGNISPITRRSENPKAYNRKKVQKEWCNPSSEPFYFLLTLI